MDKSTDKKSEVVQTRAAADSFKTGKGTTGVVPPPYQLFASNTEESELSDSAQEKITQLSSAAAPDSPDDSNSPAGNGSGLPSNLKSGIENMSGFSMDDVKVHKNSNKPAKLQAHAYAQGNEIHLGPGQEKHLPHEAWHVVQQKQGRVSADTQLKGFNVNTDNKLEQEADQMGQKALQNNNSNSSVQLKTQNTKKPVAQMKFNFGAKWVASTGSSLFGSTFGGWTQTQIDEEKTRFDTLLKDLKASADSLKSHNYYENLSTFTPEKTERDFNELKEAIDELVDDVHALENETLLWNQKDTMEETLNQKSLQVNTLLDRFSEFEEGAKAQAENENLVVQNQKEILTILGVSSTKYSSSVDKFDRDTRKRLKSRNLHSTKDQLIGNDKLNTYVENVDAVKSNYEVAERDYQEKQDRIAEARRIEQLEREEREQGAEQVALKRQKIEAKIDSGRLIDFERFFNSDYTKIETLLDNKGTLKAANLFTLAKSANANESDNFEIFISLLNSNFNLNTGINLIKEKGVAFVAEWKDHVNLFTDKLTLETLIEKTPDTKTETLKNLLASFDASGLNDLLKQKNYNYNQITDLFEKANHTKEEIAALQNTYASENSIALLQEMPNSKKLLALTNTLSNEIELRNLIKDIKGNQDATQVVEEEIEENAPSQTNIYGNEDIQRARGLIGAQGNTLEAKKLSDISSAHEKEGIKKTLDYMLNGGDVPTFSYETDTRKAKFDEYYGNGNNLLPASGNYREYYVQREPAPSHRFGSRRLLKDTNSGRIYYTNQHYDSFSRLLI